MKTYLILFLLGFVAFPAFAQKSKADSKVLEVPYKYKASKVKTTKSGLKYVIIKKGKGAIPKTGQTITAHYHGVFEDGKVFDSSFERRKPFETKIGIGRVIKGWEEAFQMLKVGTKAVIILPPNLAYGEQGGGGIPPNTTLIYHVKLLGIK